MLDLINTIGRLFVTGIVVLAASAPTLVSPPTSSQTSVIANSNTSRNWSGYTASGGKYSGISGDWLVPRIGTAGSSSLGADATWVGIGGVSTHDLIQSGTQTMTDPQGNVTYIAFIEMLPDYSHQIPVTVSPGDEVSVSLKLQAGNSWLINFQNKNNHQSYQTTVDYQSSLSSADWIEETPIAGRWILPVDDFGSINFGNGSAIKDGQTVTISQAGATPISMMNTNDQVLASPSPIAQSGDGFTVTRTDTPNVSPSPGFAGRTAFRDYGHHEISVHYYVSP